MVSGFQNCAGGYIIHDHYNVPSLGAYRASDASLSGLLEVLYLLDVLCLLKAGFT